MRPLTLTGVRASAIQDECAEAVIQHCPQHLEWFQAVSKAPNRPREPQCLAQTVFEAVKYKVVWMRV